MEFLLHILIAFLSLVVIIYTCIFFTNAIEHLGKKLNLGNNATGSILAVIGTGLPETVIPLVAIFSSLFLEENIVSNQEIAQGAIIGSPFMLLTFAMFLLGLTLLILYVLKKRESLTFDLNINDVIRNYKYFLFAYIVAISAMFFQNFKYLIVVFLLGLYVFYVYRTIKSSKIEAAEEDIEKLAFEKFFGFLKMSKMSLIVSQIIISLLFLIISSEFFVCEITYFSKLLNVSPLIISFIITPFATELPECVNSIIWIKNKKDDIAFANVIGAITFQAMVPFSIGIALTPWTSCKIIQSNVILVVLCSLLFMFYTLISRKINFISAMFCSIFYFGFMFFIFTLQ